LLHRIIDENPDADWSAISAQFKREVMDDPELLRAFFDEVIADLHKDYLRSQN
jgi:hypothetical protein